ncbi:PleD family two-component system response regulator [Geminocystis sp. NIES-3709]|uniref:response regulator n=1 Tax=Geminocystis sp. NIES-3709 TaxID=1617448 RepID=UPI0005FC997E|nr:response regulator [Geminocystis sp. NIES-3709]BAQ66751.1 two-component response regulator [Geminocystis sp. NIES-3709]
MNTILKPNQLFEDFNLPSTNGQLEIRKNKVFWQVSLLEGKIELATHSLQSGQTLKYYLRSVGAENNMKLDFLTEKNNEVRQIINLLEKGGFINSKQKSMLRKKITEDALESLFWLSKQKNGEPLTQEFNPLKREENDIINSQHLLEIEPLIRNINHRWQSWQKLNPTIISPHQRPICTDPSLLEKYTSSGHLSVEVLKQLVQLMKGLSIRELAFFVQEDELKLAQLLSTYIKHGVLKLHPPKSPLDLLPQIPLSVSQKLSTNPVEKPPVNIQKVKQTQKQHTIVCIDDSPAMLEIIESYLGINKYNLITISDPMKSLSHLFKSNPDVIVMDISMPGINGNRLCQILKSSSVFKSIPIILISGETNISEDILESTGAKHFLPKPFDKEALINLIHKYC